MKLRHQIHYGVASLLVGLFLVTIIPFTINSPGIFWNIGIYTNLFAKLFIGINGLVLIGFGLFLIISNKKRRPIRFSKRGAIFTLSLSILGALIPTIAMPLIAPDYLSAKRHESFRTPEAEGDNILRFVAFSDSGHRVDRSKNVFKRVVEIHDEFTLDGILLLGDILDGNVPREDAIELQFERPFKQLLDRGIPHYMAIGNHEIIDGHEESVVSDPRFNMEGKRYFSRTFGDDLLTVFFINSMQIDKQPTQYLWLNEAIENNTSTWKILASHYTLFGSDIDHGPSKRRYHFLEPIIDGKVDLVLSGHNHFYERLISEKNTTFVTAGHFSNPNEEDEDVPAPPESQFRMLHRRGFVYLSMDQDELILESIAENGELVDSVTLEK